MQFAAEGPADNESLPEKEREGKKKRVSAFPRRRGSDSRDERGCSRAAAIGEGEAVGPSLWVASADLG